jgi:hypothetical protein
MAKQQTPSQETVPSTAAEQPTLAVESREPGEAEVSIPPPTNRPVPVEILARLNDGYYTNHWGINE